MNDRSLHVVRGGRAPGDDAARTSSDLDSLATRAQDGDELATTRLWEEAREFLARLALAYGVPPDDVPDLVQDTMYAAHTHLADFDLSRGRFEAWVGTILVRRARNRLRRFHRQRQLLERFTESLFSGARRTSAADRAEARWTLDRLLSELTARQRQVIALYDIAELEAAEVATILGISEAGVRSVARQARQRLTRVAARLEQSQTRRQP